MPAGAVRERVGVLGGHQLARAAGDGELVHGVALRSTSRTSLSASPIVLPVPSGSPRVKSPSGEVHGAAALTCERAELHRRDLPRAGPATGREATVWLPAVRGQDAVGRAGLASRIVTVAGTPGVSESVGGVTVAPAPACSATLTLAAVESLIVIGSSAPEAADGGSAVIPASRWAAAASRRRCGWA